jgi:hypothetical protein
MVVILLFSFMPAARRISVDDAIVPVRAGYVHVRICRACVPRNPGVPAVRRVRLFGCVRALRAVAVEYLDALVGWSLFERVGRHVGAGQIPMRRQKSKEVFG